LRATQNQERQHLTAATYDQARAIALADAEDSPFLFAAHPDFQEGIVGLAAARLADQFYRPAAVAKIGDRYSRGSARSIKEFHITQALDRLGDLLERHGGHAAAAGFTVLNDRREALAEGLRAEATAAFGAELPQPSLAIDAVVPLLDVDEHLVEQLDQMEPTGYGNPRPLLAAYGLRLASARRVGRDGVHLQMQVTDGWATRRCIAFRMGDRFPSLKHRVDLAFVPEINEWNGERTVQLNVRDFREAS
jgi:single-stranded-DNA-specific exonuclease